MKKFILGLAVALCATTTAMAEVEVSGGVDFVSSYNWRGCQQSGPALQPGMAISAGGFTLSAWGSSSFDSFATTTKELDFTLSYEVGGFALSVTDYWWLGEMSPYFEDGSHLQEVTVGYTICDKLSLAWSTMIGGDDDYSSYLAISYPFEIGSVAVDTSIGINPWESAYGDKFGVSSVAVRFSKDVISTENFSLPLFVEASVAPLQDNAYLVAGVSFAF